LFQDPRPFFKDHQIINPRVHLQYQKNVPKTTKNVPQTQDLKNRPAMAVLPSHADNMLVTEKTCLISAL